MFLLLSYLHILLVLLWIDMIQNQERSSTSSYSNYLKIREKELESSLSYIYTERFSFITVVAVAIISRFWPKQQEQEKYLHINEKFEYINTLYLTFFRLCFVNLNEDLHWNNLEILTQFLNIVAFYLTTICFKLNNDF